MCNVTAAVCAKNHVAEHSIWNGIGNKNTIKKPYLVFLLYFLCLLGDLGHFGEIPESFSFAETRGRFFPISAIYICAASKGMVFEPFWSENGYRFFPLWSEIGNGFQGNHESV